MIKNMSQDADKKITVANIKTPSQENITEQIQKWLLLEEQLKVVNEKTKKMREIKRNLSTKIYEYMEINENPSLVLQNGIIIKQQTHKEYSPLTYNYIQSSLEQIIKNPTHIEYIMNYLKDNRDVKIISDIKTTAKPTVKNL